MWRRDAEFVLSESQGSTKSMGRIMEWKGGASRSSGRESTLSSESPTEEQRVTVPTPSPPPQANTSDDVMDDLAVLERETARALESVAPVHTRVARAVVRTSLDQRRVQSSKLSERRSTSPAAGSARSQRSVRSLGRSNLSIDDFDENIMNHILADAT